jgi:26S proteasome regulatory subunit N1
MEEYEAGLSVCYKIYRLRQVYPAALRIALKLNNPELIGNIMKECKDPSILKQMAFMLARQSVSYPARKEELLSIINNQKLSELYRGVAKDLQVLEPKSVEKILKRNLEEIGRGSINAVMDSAKKNLSETYVSAFVNMGFGSDDLLTKKAAEWFPKNKDMGRFAAAAGLGLIHMWDVEDGLNIIDKYLYIPDDYIAAGAYFAQGMVSCRVRSDFDPALHILDEAIKKPKEIYKIGGILGLSFSYAGTSKPEILESLIPLIIDTGYPMEISAMAALCLGIVFVGSCNSDVLNGIMQGITEREPSTLEHCLARYFALALGLVFLGQQEKIDATLEAIQLIPDPLGKFVKATLIFCAYANTGNVAKIQEMMQNCVDHLEEKDALYQVASVLGIAVIANGEEIGIEMAFRTMTHLLQYGEPGIRRVVPLALGLLSLSHSAITTMDMLTKLTYDQDREVSQAAVFGLGLIGAGTNNSRMAENFRQLAGMFHKDNDTLFMIRIAQGLLQMGKGLVTLDPMHSDRFLVSQVGLAGILAAVFACTSPKNIIFGNYHYLLFYTALAASPRVCVTVLFLLTFS